MSTVVNASICLPNFEPITKPLCLSWQAMQDISFNLGTDTYCVLPGRFMAGKTPVGPDDQSTVLALNQLADAGIDCIVNLMHEDETSVANRLYGQYDEDLAQLNWTRETALITMRFPINDMDVPTFADMHEILDVIDAQLANRKTVYVHCWGGKGRTGTVVGSWLQRHAKTDNSTVLESIQELRKSMTNASDKSPETEEQRTFVCNWNPEE
jgi:hypothetical protein